MRETLAVLLDCAAAQGPLRIADPGALGWTVTLGYVLAGTLAAGVAGRTAAGRERTFWALVAVAMCVLALNKQLDLQTVVTATGRCLARAQGWYAERRAVQRGVLLALLAGTGLAALLGLWWLRATLRRTWLALAGLGAIAVFVAVRAASIHHMDMTLRTEVLTVRLWKLWELGAVGLVLLAGLLALRRPVPAS